MSNKLILWALLILPWLTLFFMKKEDIKRFMPVAVLQMAIGITVVGAGETLKLWAVKEMAFPLRIAPYILGLNAVVTMWIFRFTYKRFWLYIVTEVVLNLGFAYIFYGYFLSARGIYQYISAKPIHLFLIITVHGILLYGYQMWQEGIYAQPYRNSK